MSCEPCELIIPANGDYTKSHHTFTLNYNILQMLYETLICRCIRPIQVAPPPSEKVRKILWGEVCTVFERNMETIQSVFSNAFQWIEMLRVCLHQQSSLKTQDLSLLLKRL